MILQDYLKTKTDRLCEASIDDPENEARLLVETISGRSRGDLRFSMSREMEEVFAASEIEALEDAFARRAAHEPLAYIVGRAPFYDLEFAVGPGVLIPRFDTEILVEAAMAALGMPEPFSTIPKEIPMVEKSRAAAGTAACAAPAARAATRPAPAGPAEAEEVASAGITQGPVTAGTDEAWRREMRPEAGEAGSAETVREPAAAGGAGSAETVREPAAPGGAESTETVREPACWTGLPETATASEPFVIYDLCTGSGCIGITVAHLLAKRGVPCEVYMTDISEAAAVYARKNAREILGADGELRGVGARSDERAGGGAGNVGAWSDERAGGGAGNVGAWSDERAGGGAVGAGSVCEGAREPGVRECVVQEGAQGLVQWRVEVADLWPQAASAPADLIVSNPPYIAVEEMAELEPEVREHEPAGALTDGSDGFTLYRRMVSEMDGHLRQGGVFAVEHGYLQKEPMKLIFEAAFTDVTCVRDLGGNDRVTLGKRRV